MYYVESGFFHPVLSLSHSSLWSCALMLSFFRCVVSVMCRCSDAFFSLLLDTGVVSRMGLWRTVWLRTRLYLSPGEHVCVSVGPVRMGGIAGHQVRWYFSSSSCCPAVFHSGRSGSTRACPDEGSSCSVSTTWYCSVFSTLTIPEVFKFAFSWWWMGLLISSDYL